MITMTSIALSTIHRADGSATFTSNGYAVIAAVNGPIDVQRRDELPEEAAIDVTVRPAGGVGGETASTTLGSSIQPTDTSLGVRERHLESIVQNTLRRVVLVSAHPRTLIQVTLQIVASQDDHLNSGSLPQATSVGFYLQSWSLR
jgi:exosome complex component RRP46